MEEPLVSTTAEGKNEPQVDENNANRGIVHREFVPKAQTINRDFYVDLLRRLRENTRQEPLDRKSVV